MKTYGPHKVPHPAVFPDAVLDAAAAMLDASHYLVLDPFAGVGKIHDLPDKVSWPMRTTGVEIEPEWAICHPSTTQGNVLELWDMYGSDGFDAVVTSPAYGNRLADAHTARDGSLRRSYTHDLGRKLHSENSGKMQWGKAYRRFHRQAWEQVAAMVKPGGRLVLNVSDHIRDGQRMYVSDFHFIQVHMNGFALVDATRVVTRRLGYGANRELRVPSELVLAFDKLTGYNKGTAI